MSTPKLLLISGSLRKESFNSSLLREAAKAFGDAEVAVADLRVPLYDGDLEASGGIPAEVQAFADQIANADALIIAAPEYNKSISGVLKNAFDWASRVQGAVFAGKPTVVLSAAAGRTGGETANFVTMQALLQLGVKIVPGPAILIAGAMNEFDQDGNLTNERYLDSLKLRMDALRCEIE